MRNLWCWTCPVCDYEVPPGDRREVEAERDEHNEQEHPPRSPLSPTRPLVAIPDYGRDW